MTNAVLVVRFLNDGRLCGYGAQTKDLIAAGTPATISITRVYLSDEFVGSLRKPCELPVTTNEMQMELWSDYSAWTNTLLQNADDTYSFSAE